MSNNSFEYSSERFDDIQLLRYRLDGFESLSLKQKLYIYCLAEATLWGRDITFDQFGKYNLRIRRALEAIVEAKIEQGSDDFSALVLYLNKVWFANGIHHHYAMDKFVPTFSQAFFERALRTVGTEKLCLSEGETLDEHIKILSKTIFDPSFLAKRVNKAEGVDIICESANNYYEDVRDRKSVV